ncbi:MAG: family acetyltransferase [Microbacteriaceae bacterium]|jgi:ribosomal-protein-serine acetyltransferase|nr:family acetyltransferase [Microbacteriaceae bacterium]
MFAVTLSPSAELRPLEVWNDVEFAANMDRAREHIRPWVGPSFVTEGVPAARATLARYGEQTARDGARIFGIWDDGVLVGGAMFVEFDDAAGTCELGCWLEPAAEGRGLITAACSALLDWAFDDRGIHRAEWHCRADNVRSAAVAERLGMTLEAVLRESWKIGDTFHNTQIWALLATEHR